MEEEILETVVENVDQVVDATEHVTPILTSGDSVFIQPLSQGLNEFGSTTVAAVEETKKMLHLDQITSYFTWANLAKIVVSLIVILLMWGIFRVLKKIVNGKAKDKMQPHVAFLLNKFLGYTFWILLVMYILGLFGVDLTAIWGAAGVAGLAVGFAAQTSVSNVISGLFVLGEKALKVGDYILVGDVSGTVEQISLLSVKVKTLDGQVVRIPNSTVIDSTLTNYNHYTIRRFVFEIPLDYSNDMTKALEAVKRVPDLCPTVLKDPAPLAFYDGYGDAVNLRLAVWFNNTDLIQTKNDVYINVVKVFKEEGLSIPFTHYDIKILNNNPVADNKPNETLAVSTETKPRSKSTRSSAKTTSGKATKTAAGSTSKKTKK